LDLDRAIAPRVWLGYCPGDGGSLRLTYPSLNSSGGQQLQLPDGDVQGVHVGLDAHRLDLDYVSRDHVFWESGHCTWALGGRLAYRSLTARAVDGSGSQPAPSCSWCVVLRTPGRRAARRQLAGVASLVSLGSVSDRRADAAPLAWTGGLTPRRSPANNSHPNICG
jgi:hypothetical protein